ncbi:hypothetical protein Y032_0254g308 [Ancylostoma ceylanicum]|nr:hypothetical protein Y032_0254g308 [Ancylostoma ceylanicum]
MRKEFNMMVSDILKILKYDASAENDPYPMSWPRPSGIGHALMAISVKVSPTFWRWFSTTGKLRLNEYNQMQGTKIMFIQEQTMRVTELNRLCMYLRVKIRAKYAEAKKRPIDIYLRKGKIELKDIGIFDPVVLAMRLQWDYQDWNGTAIEELLDERLKKEKESGRMAIGLLLLPGLESDKENQRTQSYSEVTARGIKRGAQDDQHLLPKRNAKE